MAVRKTWRSRSISSLPTSWGFRPAWTAAPTAVRAVAVSPAPKASMMVLTSVTASGTPPRATARSSADNVSRADPAPVRTAQRFTSSLASSPASATTWSTSSVSWLASSRCTSKCWVRLRMVGSSFCGSVVASTNTTWSGGSSSVLSSALDAFLLSMWTSSRMYTLRLPGVPTLLRSINSRMASTLLLEAASSSNTSNDPPSAMATHDSHTPHGSPSLTSLQLRALARMRAVVVLPVPRGPLSR